MVQAFKPRVDLRIRMRGQRRSEELDSSLCDRQIVVEGMRREGDRTRVKCGESLQLGQGLLQVFPCLDNRSRNLCLHLCHCPPPIHRSMGVSLVVAKTALESHGSSESIRRDGHSPAL